MKQTAVEWLVEQLKEYDFADIKDTENYIIKIPAWILTEKEDQAKAMEKEQREKDFVEGYKTRALASNLIFDKTSELFAKSLFEQNQTFKSE